MRAEKTRKRLAETLDVVLAPWYCAKMSELHQELDQLEAKAAELDNRENGVATIVSYDGFTCSRCGCMEEYKFKYCPNCGHRLIGESEDEL